MLYTLPLVNLPSLGVFFSMKGLGWGTGRVMVVLQVPLELHFSLLG